MSLECRYTRKALKRGPNKNYIKDLEAQLNSLQAQIAGGAAPTEASDMLRKPSLEQEMVRQVSGSSVGSMGDSAVSADDLGASSLSELPQALRGLQTRRTIRPLRLPSGEVDWHPVLSAKKIGQGTAIARASRRKLLEYKAARISETQQMLATTAAGTNSAFEASLETRTLRLREDRMALQSAKDAFIRAGIQGVFPIVRPGVTEALHFPTSSPENEDIPLESNLLAHAMMLFKEPAAVFAVRGIAMQESTEFGPASPASPAMVVDFDDVTALRQLRAEIVGSAITGCDLKRSTRDEKVTLSRRSPERSSTANEIDALLICYLDALRSAEAGQAILAAASHKCQTATCAALVEGKQLSEPDTARHLVIFMMCTFHSLAFGRRGIAPMLPSSVLPESTSMWSKAKCVASRLGFRPTTLDTLQACYTAEALQQDISEGRGTLAILKEADDDVLIRSSFDQQGSIRDILEAIIRLCDLMDTSGHAEAGSSECLPDVASTAEKLLLVVFRRFGHGGNEEWTPESAKSPTAPVILAVTVCACIWLVRLKTVESVGRRQEKQGAPSRPTPAEQSPGDFQGQNGICAGESTPYPSGWASAPDFLASTSATAAAQERLTPFIREGASKLCNEYLSLLEYSIRTPSASFAGIGFGRPWTTLCARILAFGVRELRVAAGSLSASAPVYVESDDGGQGSVVAGPRQKKGTGVLGDQSLRNTYHSAKVGVSARTSKNAEARSTLDSLTRSIMLLGPLGHVLAHSTAEDGAALLVAAEK